LGLSLSDLLGGLHTTPTARLTPGNSFATPNALI
jgi:hypothetical protein